MPADRPFDHLIMPCCPICDNAIEDWESGTVIAGNGAKALAHSMCVEAETDDEDDE